MIKQMRFVLSVVTLFLITIIWSIITLFGAGTIIRKYIYSRTNETQIKASHIMLPDKIYVNSTSDLQKNQKLLSPGGLFATNDLRINAIENTKMTDVIIIFPFRDRTRHYSEVMQALTVNKKKHWNLTVFVIHQDDTDYFRRAWLINIGLKIAMGRFGDDVCAVTHDVDMLPSAQIDYTWCDLPTQICSELSCFHNNVPYPAYAGGVVQASLKHWKQINGMTNRAFGWGGEDDDLFYRLKANKYTPIRRPKRGHGKCTCLNDSNHTKRITSHMYNSIVQQIERLKRGSNEWKTDGLNDLHFDITSQYVDSWGSNWFNVVASKKREADKKLNTPTEMRSPRDTVFKNQQIRQKSIVNSNVKITKSDRIMQGGYDASPIVLEQHRLVLFTIPKSACTVIKQLARRIAGKSDWSIGGENIPHNPAFNGLTCLSSFNVEKATSIMTSPNWTRAVFVRDTHVRILSAYLDKAVKRDYVKRVCGTQPETFSDFIRLITKCKDSHWQSQRSFIDDKWWPFINFIGHIETAANDTKRLLHGIGLWEQYGKYGWGEKNESIFRQNHLKSRATGSDDKILSYYTIREWNKVNHLFRDDMEFLAQNRSLYFLPRHDNNQVAYTRVESIQHGTNYPVQNAWPISGIESGSVPKSNDGQRGSRISAQEAAKWSSYRLGDILRYWWAAFKEWKGAQPFPCRDQTTCNPFVCNTWPDSIGCRFLQSASLRLDNENFVGGLRYIDSAQRDTVFYQIVAGVLQDPDGETPSENTVVVHVRLSDALTRDNCWGLPPCMYAGRLYVYPLTWYDKVVQDIRNAFPQGVAPTIEVIGYAHHAVEAKNIHRSNDYRAKMVQYFKQHGFSASVRQDNLPDRDFLYMTRARFFVPGGGGFSRMIARLAQRHDGRIFRVQDLNTTLLGVSPAL